MQGKYIIIINCLIPPSSGFDIVITCIQEILTLCLLGVWNAFCHLLLKKILSLIPSECQTV